MDQTQRIHLPSVENINPKALKLRILYIADRINSADGSSVHCRAFVDSIIKLGHDIMTYPAMTPIDYRPRKKVPASEKNLWYYLRRIDFKLIKSYLHRSNAYISEYLSFLEGLFGSIRQYGNLKKILKNDKADVIIFRYHPYNFAPFWVSRKNDVPVVLEVNSLRSMENKLKRRHTSFSLPTRWAEHYALSSADAIFAVSMPILKKIQSFTQDKLMQVVENGVDCDHFDPKRCSKQEAKRKLGLTSKTVIGYVGSYMPWHDLDTTIETLRILRTIDENYHLLLIGHGVDYERIKQTVVDKRLSQAVTFIESVPHDQINEYMAAFDVALMSYPRLDNFHFSPLKMFEYLAMELAVVTTNVGQLSEIITNKKNGLLVDNPTPENFAKAVQSSINDNHQIGREARRLVRENYSWLNNAQKIVTLSEKAIEQYPGA